MKKFSFRHLCRLLCAITLPAHAMTDTIDFIDRHGVMGELSWSISGGTLRISGIGAMPDFDFESFPWYSDCESISSVVIEEGVSTIGSYAFCRCRNLTSITIPTSVTSIGNYAFAYCLGLKSVSIPNSVITIGEYSFYRCSGLTSISIPNSITK